jgi:hypothetical protein
VSEKAPVGHRHDSGEGLQDDFKGRLGTMSKCISVLEGAGYSVSITESEEEAERLFERLKLEEKARTE